MIQVINKYGQLKTITISITSSGVTDVTASLPILSTGGATPNISLGANSITNSYFRQSSGLSIVGRSVNSVGNVADIIASTNYTILRRTGTSIGFGTLVAEHLNPTYTNGYVLSTDGSGVLSWIASVGTPSHNSLSGLQGGTPTEYYHLTAAQHTVAIQAASSTLNGYLTSTDWTTFNGKQNALGFTPEDVSNKATDFTVINDTLYPTVEAVKEQLDLIPVVDDNVFLTHYPVGSIITLNNYTSTISSVAFSSTTSNSNNLTKFQPFVTNKAITIDELYLSISAGNNGASATVTFYVFDDTNDGFPGVKLHQEISAVGALNVTNTILTFATNVVLQPGVYWIGIHIRGLNTGGTNPTFYFASLGGNTKGIQTTAITYTNNFQCVLGAAATVSDLTDNPTILVSSSTALSVPMLKIKIG